MPENRKGEAMRGAPPAHSMWTRGIVAAVLTTSSLGMLGTHAAAGATDPRLTPAQIHHLLRPAPGMQALPPPQIARRIHASIGPNTAGNLTYHGGPVMQQANNSVALFWLPTTLQDGSASQPSANYVSLIEQYFDDIGGSALNELTTQYYQTVNGPTEYITNASDRLLAVIDTSAYPAAGSDCAGNGTNCVDDTQIRAYVQGQIQNSNGALPEDLSTEYYVFLAPHESSCFNPTFCFKSDTGTTANFSFCSYHDYFSDTVSGDTVIYANVPYGALAANGTGCTTLSHFPNERDADITISATSHEQLEGTTDPLTDAWYFQSITGEIGDECAYDYGPMSFDGGIANQQIHGHYYAVQREWSNAISGCAQAVLSAPANDNFASAQTLPGTPDSSGTTLGTTVGATKQTGEPAPSGNPGLHSVWYSITPAQSGQLRVDTCTSDFDTMLGVYTGNAVNALTKKSDNDDSCGDQSAVTLAVTAGVKYWIEVDGYGGDWGDVTLEWWLAHSNRIVSTSWSTAEAARLDKMGLSLGPVPGSQVPRVSVYTISYILGFVSPTPTPAKAPSTGTDVTYTSFWTPSEFGVIDRVKNKYVLNDSQATVFATKIVDYLLALGGH